MGRNVHPRASLIVVAFVCLLAGATAARAQAPCGAVQDYIYAGSRLVAVAGPPLPTVAIGAPTASVLERPGAIVTVTVGLATSGDCPIPAAASVAYSTEDGTAVAGVDYLRAAGTLSFPAGSPSGTTASFDVALINDTQPEPNRSFSVVLSAPAGVSLGVSTEVITIVDNDTPVVSFTFSASRVSENGSWATDPPLVRVLTDEGNALAGTLRVRYACADGTAVAGADYLPPSGELTFPEHSASGSVVPVDLDIVQDALIESDETFKLTLVPSHGLNVGAPSQHVVTVASDDVVLVSGTMVAQGSFAVGGTVTYTVVLTNSGPGAQADNPGDEFTDTLPAGLTLLPPGAPGGSTASTGVLGASGNTLIWNGALPSDGTVTVSVRASVNPGTNGQVLSNQGTVRFDSNASGDNDAPVPTDDPRAPGTGDPTAFQVGWGPTSFHTLAPCRVIDTRNANGPRGGPPLPAGGERDFTLAGSCSIPVSAKAVAFNITVTGATGGGILSLRPAGIPREPVSTLSYGAGQTRSNNGMAVLNPTGEITIACNQAAGTVHLILDVSGYFE